VLFRAGYLSADLEIELANRRIPYEKWGGLKFLEAAHIKDMLAFLRVLENPRDEVSWYRLLRLLPGVGDATARAAVELLSQHDWAPMAIGAVRAPSRAKPGLQAMAALLDGMRRVNVQAPAEAIPPPTRRPDSRHHDDAPPIGRFDQLEVIAAGYPDRATFLAALALEPPSAAVDNDALILSTAHSAKGKEFDVVFVIWAADGIFPMARSADKEDEVDEERRLLYVAMTRARDQLYVTYPLHSYPSRTGADFAYGQLSRFLDPGVRGTMQRVTLGDDMPPSLPAMREDPSIDLRALLRGRFGTPGSSG
jgi:DNA helicase-2/ATP-dependent DNA helicase PcrA